MNNLRFPFAALYIKLLVEEMLDRELDPDEFLHSFGLSAELLPLSRYKLMPKLLYKLAEAAEDRLQDDSFILRRCITSKHMSTFACVTAMRASESTYEAMNSLVRVAGAESVVLPEIYRRESTLVVRMINPHSRHRVFANSLNDILIAPIINLCTQGFINPEAIQRILLPSSNNASQRIPVLQKAIGGVTIDSFADFAGIDLDWQISHLSNLHREPVLAAAAEKAAIANLSRAHSEDLVERVKRLINESMMGGRPDKKAVASYLGMSISTLQRRLADMGASYSELLQECRHVQACRYLKDANYNLAEVASMLGFQDQSNFVKAFKNWHGMTPGQYRILIRSFAS